MNSLAIDFYLNALRAGIPKARAFRLTMALARRKAA